QASLFVAEDMPRAAPSASFRIWRTSVTVGDLQQLAGRYLGTDRAARSFSEYAIGRGQPLVSHAEADIGSIRFTEHLLTSAIGAASSRLVLTLLLRRGNVGRQSDLRLLDDASEALQYNRDLLQSALDQVRHGLSVFDKDLRLICWNRQFRELLELPQDLGRVGVPLDRILRVIAARGDAGGGSIDAHVSTRLMQLAVKHETFQERIGACGRILEIRTSPMPQGGIVTTYSDITERVQAANALAEANDALEGRVVERTAELTKVNGELIVAKAAADAANLDKTRFLAAASHDILQPLNAARLYATSLSESLGRGAPIDAPTIARNIDASLGAVEEILSTLLDISRLDSGNLQPEISAFPLQPLFDQLTVEFQPLAAERRLALRFKPTSHWVESDRRLLRRVLQNLIANAIKYTPTGTVLVGCRRRGSTLSLEVLDTGPGIPEAKRELIFKEFQRLEETATSVKGLGLGLAIVERICRVLGTPITVASVLGRGSRFAVSVRKAAPALRPRPSDASMDRMTGLGVNVGGLLVLVIDNEPDVVSGMRLLLEGWGCDVITANSI
ncbi:MAG TPA: PAS-domain containing protein, partial [Hyphomicrobiaceae bacterium]|nr:PAS-domain containing protein [Hyphomicrobiaceae bacterium]